MATRPIVWGVDVKDVEIATILLPHILRELLFIQSQLAYAQSLDKETVFVWGEGGRIEVNRLEWIAEAENDISVYRERITQLNNIISG